MIPAFVDHLWQSTLFAGAAWLLTLTLKKNRAQVRHWIWFTASVKFLVPFSLLLGLGSMVPRHAGALPVQAAWVAAAEQIGEPLSTLSIAAVQTAAARPSVNYVAVAALIVWACGFAAIAVCWLLRWRRLLKLRRSAMPTGLTGVAVPVVSASGLIEPGVFGVFRPVLLLPAGITERLSADQLEAILAHELCHVRRRDNLTAAIHMVVQATFWFHPLVWWLGMRLTDERERACDEEVLRLGNTPRVYAEGILNVCKLYVESPLACAPGVTGSNLKRRIEAIMKNRMALRLNLARKLVLSAAGIVALTTPIAIGILRAQARAQPPSAAAPKWEVASIKSCKDFGAGERGATRSLSPDRLTLGCYVAQSLLLSAYLQFADGVDSSGDPELVLAPPIEGGPSWLNSERFTINAKAESNASPITMQGPMLQALLEERFKLKAHFETKRDQPAYALTVAKGGPKLKPFVEGSCTRHDKIPLTPQPGDCLQKNTFSGGNIVIDEQGITVDEFRNIYLRRSPFNGIDRPVIDRTGLAGRYNIHFENALSTPPALRQQNGDDDKAPTGPSLFDALQEQLGLKLEPIRAPKRVLVIDHIERPSEN